MTVNTLRPVLSRPHLKKLQSSQILFKNQKLALCKKSRKSFESRPPETMEIKHRGSVHEKKRRVLLL